MRNNYYDDRWQWDAARVPRPPVPAPRPPREPAPPSAPRDDYRRTPLPARARWRGAVAFALCLALLAGLIGTSLWLRGGLPQGGGLLERLPGLWEDWAGGDSDGDAVVNEDWTRYLADTAMERSPTGGGFALDLAERAGAALTPAELYRAVSPSIAGIRVTSARGLSTGTGVVLSSDGYLITNAHVIAGALRADALLPNGRRVDALLVGYDMETDLAVLKIDAPGLTPARFGSSAALQVGDPVYAIGNPLGEELRGTMTDGIVSALDRSVTSYNGSMTLIQTTAALNSGNSGGALVNAAGEVVGITNMKMMSGEETIEGLGFAIPSSLVRIVAEDIVAQGYFTGLPMLGVTVSNHYDENGGADGALVKEVDPASDAARQGILEGDVIVGAGGAAVTGMDDLQRAKNGLRAGDRLTLDLITVKGPRQVTVTLSPRQPDA